MKPYHKLRPAGWLMPCDDTDRSLLKINSVLKRIFDIICATIGIIVFSPLFLVIYIAIKREDKGRAIFCQERIGYHGKPFTLYKFRSMSTSAEAGGTPMLCMKEDDRQTKVGSFLRAHHLDELPQLWNVLKGDMSFVGYRPERKYFIDQIILHNSNYGHFIIMLC